MCLQSKIARRLRIDRNVNGIIHIGIPHFFPVCVRDIGLRTINCAHVAAIINISGPVNIVGAHPRSIALHRHGTRQIPPAEDRADRRFSAADCRDHTV